jgi:poly-gamma-glutamate synthesis protein (capsule biosynthesis protein)
MILSGCADAQPAGDVRRRLRPHPGRNIEHASGQPSGQPTKQPAAKPQRTSVTVVMNGDLLWHNTLWYSAKEDARRRGRGGYDFAPLLAGMKPVVASADLAICHEEVPLAPAGGPPKLSALLSSAAGREAIKATGYDVCTTASNHAVDQGFGGVRRTLDDLDRVKIAHAGTARSRNRSGQRFSRRGRVSRSASSLRHSV